MTCFNPFIRPAIAAALVAAFFAAVPYQVAQAQRTSLTDIGQKLDGVQNTLGPVPTQPGDEDIQQRLDGLEQMLCSFVDASARGALGRCNRVVFVTKSSFTGNLGGLSGADTKCNTRAEAAGLPGTYKAWLSDSTGSPSTRFTRSDLPYVLASGRLVADDYSDLTSGVLRSAINLTARGEFRIGIVWTNTLDDGTLGNLRALPCGNWSKTQPPPSQENPFVGDNLRTDTAWTFGNQGRACSDQQPLYCFQQ